MILPAPAIPFVPGELPGVRIARIVQMYAGCALGTRQDELAALIGRGVCDESMVAWRTNCATFALGVLAASGCSHYILEAPTLIGRAFSDLVQLGNEMHAWQPGNSGPIPVGALLHYGITGENDDHAEFYLSPIGPQHGGGGRPDNAITVGTGPVALSMGRPIEQWLDPGALGITVALSGPDDDTQPEIAAGPTSEPHT